MNSLESFCRVLAFIGLGLGVSLGYVINAVSGRRVLNPGTLAYVGVGLAAVAGFAAAYIGLSQPNSPQLDAFQRGRAFGGIVGSVLVPSIIAFFFHRVNKRPACGSNAGDNGRVS